MPNPSASPLSARCLAAGTAVLAASLLLAPPALAQDDSGPFGFLKPWIEEQLFGRETPGAPATPDDLPLPPDERGGGQSDEAAAPEAASSPAVDTAAGGVLRGTTAPEDAVPATPDVDAPAAGALDVTSPADVAVEPAGPQPLRFALLAGRSISATMAAVGPIADDLAQALGRPVELLPLASYDAMIDAQEERRIDGGFFSAAAFALAETQCSCLEPIVAPRASDGTLAYHALIVVRADSGIASLPDLEGKTVAVGAADSIGARRAQLAGLMAEGFDPATAFGAVLEVESADAAVRLVEAGGADAAFAWSTLAGDAASGYSRGTLTSLVASGEIAMDRIAILWRSAAIGHGPFALLRTLPEADKTKIEAYLVGLAAANPAAYDMLNPFYGGGYAPVDPQSYGGLQTLMAQNVDAVRMPVGPARTGATAVAPSDPIEPASAAPGATP